MTAEEKLELEKRMLAKAKEFLELVLEFIPEGSHASMAVWPDHLSVDIFSRDESIRGIHAWADPGEPEVIHT